MITRSKAKALAAAAAAAASTTTFVNTQSPDKTDFINIENIVERCETRYHQNKRATKKQKNTHTKSIVPIEPHTSKQDDIRELTLSPTHPVVSRTQAWLDSLSVDENDDDDIATTNKNVSNVVSEYRLFNTLDQFNSAVAEVYNINQTSSSLQYVYSLCMLNDRNLFDMSSPINTRNDTNYPPIVATLRLTFYCGMIDTLHNLMKLQELSQNHNFTNELIWCAKATFVITKMLYTYCPDNDCATVEKYFAGLSEITQLLDNVKRVSSYCHTLPWDRIA